jgi:hypothetical protein
LPNVLKRLKDRKQPRRLQRKQRKRLLNKKQLLIRKRPRHTLLRVTKTCKTMKKKLKNTVASMSRKITTIKKRIKLLLRVNPEEVTTGVVAAATEKTAEDTEETAAATATTEAVIAEVVVIGAAPELLPMRMMKDSSLKLGTRSHRIAAIVADTAATGKAVVAAIVEIAVIAEAEAKVAVQTVAVRVEPRQNKTRLNQPAELRRPKPRVSSEVEARFV